ncbi:cation transporter [Puia dinghuensis]|uniref:Cation transporter n=2 Tax=Puia dinghuensis TaxID=1792502 RepID=A0A8J2U9T4_9BACT|nr:cation transporter [Puia dinghuensis]
MQLSLPQAEKMFLDSNLQLLAQRYNIDASRALVIQARLWPNPNLSLAHVLYSGTLHKWFPTHGDEDETSGNLSQLILLAGKRNKQIKLAQENAHLTEYQFFDLLRTLKYTLRTDFFQIHYLRQSAAVYDEEIRALDQIVKAFMQQEGKGYIAEKEVIRIKAQLYSFQSEYNDLINQINSTESELRLVLQMKPNFFIEPMVDSSALSKLDPGQYPLTTLVDSAYNNRTDLQIAKTNTAINQLNYKYQKALAVPDLTLDLGFDERGSYLPYYYYIGASMDLPFFNRNQGNIKSAKAQIANTQALQRSTQATVEENVSNALRKAFNEQRLYQTIDPKFFQDFSRLLHEVVLNYQKRNITILEFLDFYDSFKMNTLQLNTIQFNRVSAFEDINYYTGTNFFN